MNKTPHDPTICPLCEQPNECGLVAGKGSCWCFDLSIPSDKRDAPPCEASHDTCLCRACLSELGRPAAVLRTMAESIRRWR